MDRTNYSILRSNYSLLWPNCISEMAYRILVEARFSNNPNLVFCGTTVYLKWQGPLNHFELVDLCFESGAHKSSMCLICLIIMCL